MISLNNVTLMRGQQTLFEDASLTLRGGQRTGIIGRNGAGKTSLFKALEQEIPIEQGSIELPNGLRTSTMSQETPGSNRRCPGIRYRRRHRVPATRTGTARGRSKA
jgi:ATP-binding cassette subfamily F protein 3